MESFFSTQTNWIDLQQSLGIVGGLLLNTAGLVFTFREFRRNMAATVVANRLAITTAHRELTLFRLSQPALSLIKQLDRNMANSPLTPIEMDWLSLNFLHLSSCFFAVEKRQYERPDRLVEDVRSFLVLPAPRSAWELAKPFQNKRFVAFVENCLSIDGSELAVMQVLNSM